MLKKFGILIPWISAVLANPAPIPEETFESSVPLEKRFDPVKNGQFYNNKTAPFFVDGNRILNVPFDAGESYAGLTPVDTNVTEADKQLMFSWFFPTVNPAGKDDVIIWLNGGPGCSSLAGLIQENGPLLWRPGVYAPVPNRFSWHKLANVVWVEYPIGTGFSNGRLTAHNNDEAADEFLRFWKNLLNTFDGLQNKNIYISGESYAGLYVPYIGAAMLAKNDTKYYNVKGAIYYDPVMPDADGLGLDHAIMPAFHRYWENVFALPQAAKDLIERDAVNCKLDEYFDSHLTFPPPPTPWQKVQIDGCDVVADFNSYVAQINACYNPYHIQDTCPILYDVLGYPNPVYIPQGASLWLNQPAIQRRLHVDHLKHTWAMCQGPVFAGDKGDNYNGTQHAERLRTLIEGTNNVLIGSGRADNIIQSNKTALGIQMLEWNGKQGFHTAPKGLLMLPPITNDYSNIAHWNGHNEQGTSHTERGLTHSEIYLAGHMVPQYTPSAAFRQLEFVLGRIPDLGSGAPFSINLSNRFIWPY